MTYFLVKGIVLIKCLSSMILDIHIQHIEQLKNLGIHLDTKIPKLAQQFKVSIDENAWLKEILGFGQNFKPLFEEVNLFSGTSEQIKNFDPDKFVRGAPFVFDFSPFATFYHELTHAISYKLKKKDNNYLSLITGSSTYYSKKLLKGVPKRKGVKVSDPDRVTEEAIASYIGDRINFFLFTINKLRIRKHLLKEGELSKEKYQDALKEIISEYNANQNYFYFGYQEFESIETQVDAEMPTGLISFLNKTLLSEELTSRFEKVVSFKNILTNGF